MIRISRRRLVAGAVAMMALPRAAFAEPATATQLAARGRLQALFAEMEQAFLRQSPEHATSMGLDKGALAPARFQLDDRSIAARRTEQAEHRLWVKRLRAIDRKRLAPSDQIDLEVMERLHEYRFDLPALPGIDAGSPYVVTQRHGSYQAIPQFLAAQHKIEQADDIDAYLARMRSFAVGLDQETERVRFDAGRGIVPPDFILDGALAQLRKLRDVPAADSQLVRSLVQRAAEKSLTPDRSDQAQAIFVDHIVPALTRQIGALDALRAGAGSVAGIGRLPHGAALYQSALRAATTTRRTAAELQAMGESLVQSLTAECDRLMRGLGHTEGTVVARFAALSADRSLNYPDTPAGAEQALADAQALIAGMQSRLSGMFGVLPKADVIAVRVPPETEQGAAGGYYNPGTLDGSRAGAFYLNLRPGLARSKWELPSLVYHESIPGHHMHASLQQESALPLIRKAKWFNAFNEGWSLYAELLADELGMYENNPLGRLGYLKAALFRAARLVVDTGLHARGWSREQAVAYLHATAGMDPAAARNEVERYCTMPGQACAYMAGRQTILALRRKAQQALGDRFDIRAFHDCILLGGSVPMEILEIEIDRFIAARKNP